MTPLKELKCMAVKLVKHGQTGVQLSMLTLQPLLMEQIQLNQETELELQQIE